MRVESSRERRGHARFRRQRVVATRSTPPLLRLHLARGGTIENARAMAAHELPGTTKPYDRTNESPLMKRQGVAAAALALPGS
jgi:hypothetical protein